LAGGVLLGGPGVFNFDDASLGGAELLARGLGGLRRFLGRRLCGRRGGVGFVLVLLGMAGAALGQPAQAVGLGGLGQRVGVHLVDLGGDGLAIAGDGDVVADLPQGTDQAVDACGELAQLILQRQFGHRHEPTRLGYCFAVGGARVPATTLAFLPRVGGVVDWTVGVGLLAVQRRTPGCGFAGPPRAGAVGIAAGAVIAAGRIRGRTRVRHGARVTFLSWLY
jgi:hypothetical protein